MIPGHSPIKLIDQWKRGKTSSSVRRPWMMADRGTSNESTKYSKVKIELNLIGIANEFD